MAETQIKVGTVVALRSGSPKMTVTYVSEGKATCQYFHDGEIKWVELPLEALYIT